MEQIMEVLCFGSGAMTMKALRGGGLGGLGGLGFRVLGV